MQIKVTTDALDKQKQDNLLKGNAFVSCGQRELPLLILLDCL